MSPGAAIRLGLLPALLGWLSLAWMQEAPAATGVTASFVPAWEGRYLPGRATEIGIDLLATTGGPFQVVVESGGGRVLYRGVLEAGTPLVDWLPLPAPRPGEAVVVSLSLNGEEVLREQVPFMPVAAPLAVAVRPMTGDASRPALSIPPRELPRTADGYRSVASLSMPLEALPQLDGRQLEALRDFVGSCGTLLLPARGARLLRDMQAIAGCGGKGMRILGPGSSAETPVPPVQPLPFPAAEAGENPARLLLLFFPVYLLALALPLFSRRGRLPLVVVPVLGTLVLMFAWPRQDNPARLFGWAETESGSRSARYTAVLDVTGTSGSSALRIDLPRRFGIPCCSSAPPVMEFHPGYGDRETLVMGVRPFSRLEYRFEGSLPVPYRVLLETGQDTPRVTNRGRSATPAAWLGWRRGYHSVPPLAPGQSWRPSPQDAVDEPGDLPGWARQLGSREETVLLLPMRPGDAGAATSGTGLRRHEGWLLVRPTGEHS